MALNFQQRGSALVRRVLFGVLLVASLAMTAVYAREGDDGALHRAQAAVSGAAAPLKLVGATASSGAQSAGEALGDLAADADTLSELRAYNEQLVEQYAQMEEYRQENERLRQLVDLKDTYGIEGVGARVIGNPAGAWDQTVTIDKGSDDGVDAGLTVMGTSGVIGQVVAADARTATVRLLTDPKSGAAALVQSSRAQGVVRGSLEGLLYLEDLEADAEVAEGDLVVTSGLGGSYTRGLVIGTVVKVDAKQGESSRRAVVSPNESASALEEVLVVFSALEADGDDGENANGAEGGDAE
ncbi:rod shape-determining protein MreC [Gordonibacter sp. An230]|uniref:rod shape-determining protein MreC n=1 Tax=Gordonibacter sp. An230 TaxID=1965592 RepID=UPI000B369F64|nr:rod shape-determining protein MreC [Gordonibacter sp. An230]OUO90861.1 rod shape-determining protein MreC [Gordonibacter sp. An230]